VRFCQTGCGRQPQGWEGAKKQGLKRCHLEYFVAGECGVLLDNLEKLSDYLRDLYTFVWNYGVYEDKLPEDIVAEGERLYYYIEEFDSLTFSLISSYKYSLEHMKDNFESWCEIARSVIEEVNEYLEQRKDLCRAHAISKL
jgi:hypothetical protein